MANEAAGLALRGWTRCPDGAALIRAALGEWAVTGDLPAPLSAPVSGVSAQLRRRVPDACRAAARPAYEEPGSP
jgi:hypothetical protein